MRQKPAFVFGQATCRKAVGLLRYSAATALAVCFSGNRLSRKRSDRFCFSLSEDYSSVIWICFLKLVNRSFRNSDIPGRDEELDIQGGNLYSENYQWFVSKPSGQI